MPEERSIPGGEWCKCECCKKCNQLMVKYRERQRTYQTENAQLKKDNEQLRALVRKKWKPKLLSSGLIQSPTETNYSNVIDELWEDSDTKAELDKIGGET